jgi:hypothetical protein
MRLVRNKAPLLKQKIQKYMNVAFLFEEGDSASLRKEVMSIAREIYQKNFENVLDVEPYKVWAVALWTLAGLALGGAGGYGINRYFKTRNKVRASWQRRYTV